MSIGEVQKSFRDRLSTIYKEGECRTITQMVLEKTLALDKLHLSLERFRLLTLEQTEILEKILARLLNKEPVQYVLGEADFCGLKFKVNANVLIPRPETEELVHWIEGEKPLDSEFHLLDIGTGTGCIPITLSKHYPKAIMEGGDISKGALSVARENNLMHQTSVHFFHLDILGEILPSAKYDIIVSNPPYITQGEKPTIEENVMKFEPHLALFSPPGDDLLFYRIIGEKAFQGLKETGVLFFEINEYKGKEIIALLQKIGYKDVILRQDINRTDRMIRASK